MALDATHVLCGICGSAVDDGGHMGEECPNESPREAGHRRRERAAKRPTLIPEVPSGQPGRVFVSRCHGEPLTVSIRSAILVGHCDVCWEVLGRTNPRTGKGEWLNGAPHDTELDAVPPPASRELVYICAPWRRRTEESMERVRRAIRDAVLGGYVPIFAPLLLDVSVDGEKVIDDEKPEDRVVALEIDKAILERCSLLVLVGPEITEGMRHELSVWKGRVISGEELAAIAAEWVATEGGAIHGR